MNRLHLPAFLLVLIVSAVTGCTGGPKRGTEVTRFHLDQPIPAQSVSLRESDERSIEFGTYEKVVADELALIGYPVTEGEDTALFVDIDIFRGMQAKARSRSPVSVGIGGGSFGGNIGLGGGVSLPVGGGPAEIYLTKLEVRFVDREENAIVWEGRASKESKAAPTNPEATMRQIAKALLTGFPGESGKTIVIADSE